MFDRNAGELYPRRWPEADPALVSEYLDYLRKLPAAELIQAAADDRMSALSDVMADVYSVSHAEALAEIIDTLGLRSAVADETLRRSMLPAPAPYTPGPDDLPF